MPAPAPLSQTEKRLFLPGYSDTTRVANKRAAICSSRGCLAASRCQLLVLWLGMLCILYQDADRKISLSLLFGVPVQGRPIPKSSEAKQATLCVRCLVTGNVSYPAECPSARQNKLVSLKLPTQSRFSLTSPREQGEPQSLGAAREDVLLLRQASPNTSTLKRETKAKPVRNY